MSILITRRSPNYPDRGKDPRSRSLTQGGSRKGILYQYIYIDLLRAIPLKVPFSSIVDPLRGKP